MKKWLWILIIIIILIIVSLFLVIETGIDLKFLPKCGSSSDIYVNPIKTCTCLGVSYKPIYFGGGPVRCIGFCLKESCKCSIIDRAIEQRVEINCPSDSLLDHCWVYNYYKQKGYCEKCQDVSYSNYYPNYQDICATCSDKYVQNTCS